MCKLYFYYGVMNSSKTANLLLQAHSLEENEIPFLCLKSSRDTRDGDIIRSRIGIERKAVLIEDNTDVYKAIEIYNTLLNTSDKKLQWILVDEAQFLTTGQIDALAKAVDYLDVNVCCYGLRTDFKSKLFEGSKRLMELADEIKEIKSTCKCGRKASINARIDKDNNIIFSGEQVAIEGKEANYKPICRKCFFEKKDCLNCNEYYV